MITAKMNKLSHKVHSEFGDAASSELPKDNFLNRTLSLQTFVEEAQTPQSSRKRIADGIDDEDNSLSHDRKRKKVGEKETGWCE